MDETDFGKNHQGDLSVLNKRHMKLSHLFDRFLRTVRCFFDSYKN